MVAFDGGCKTWLIDNKSDTDYPLHQSAPLVKVRSVIYLAHKVKYQMCIFFFSQVDNESVVNAVNNKGGSKSSSKTEEKAEKEERPKEREKSSDRRKRDDKDVR